MSNRQVWHEASIATLSPKGVIENAAMIIEDGKIEWVGKANELSDSEVDGATWHSAKGALITPGLIDCHTHVVYGGNRAQEWKRRLNGGTNGGGILSTVDATRAATETDLFKSACERVRAMLRGGVTTIEIKSGYGLDFDTERRMLQVARSIQKKLSIDVYTTFLGAHTLPKEFKEKSEYIQHLAQDMLPAFKRENLIDALDAYCDQVAFSTDELEVLFQAAQNANIPIKVHSDQLSFSGGSELAAKYGALSADHLEYIDENGVQAMAQTNMVAVLLPGAHYFLNEKKMPPVHLFRQYKVPMAISTDCNPGTSPTTSLLLMMNMACVRMGLTPDEALAGVTLHAAKALGQDAIKGSLEKGKLADFVLWSCHEPLELSYYFGWDPCIKVIKRGNIIYERSTAL